MMDQLITRFPAQLHEALEIGRNAKLNNPQNQVHNIVVTGLGGSGIGGDFVQSMIRNTCGIPYIVNKRYHLPEFVNKHTLLIASSYSGNTEETLSAVSEASETGAHIVMVSSGGKMIQKAINEGHDYIKVPDNWPSPRACLGYSIVQQLFILNKLNFIDDKLIHQIEKSANYLSVHQDRIKTEAEKIAKQLLNKTAVIYIEDRMEPVAIRFRQQLNENAKVLCWHHVIPEMNHNELVGWKDRRDDLAVIFIENEDDYSRNKRRMDISAEIIAGLTNTIVELKSEGDTFVEQNMYLVHMVDWISCYLSELRGVDNMEVKAIDYLKAELAKI